MDDSKNLVYYYTFRFFLIFEDIEFIYILYKP